MHEHTSHTSDKSPSLKVLYARLLAQRPEHADGATAYAIGRAVRADAEALSAALAGERRSRPAPVRLVNRPAVRWSLAAAVALVAVFAARQLGQDPGPPTGLPAQDPADLIANAEPVQPLFSGSFEPERDRQPEPIFNSDFGS